MDFPGPSTHPIGIPPVHGPPALPHTSARSTHRSRDRRSPTIIRPPGSCGDPDKVPPHSHLRSTPPHGPRVFPSLGQESPLAEKLSVVLLCCPPPSLPKELPPHNGSPAPYFRYNSGELLPLYGFPTSLSKGFVTFGHNLQIRFQTIVAQCKNF